MIRADLSERCGPAADGTAGVVGTLSIQASRSAYCPHAHHDVPQLSGVERAFLHEAEVVAPRVHHVEGALARWSLDGVGGRLAMYPIRSERVEVGSALMDVVQVAYGEIERLW